MDAVNDVAPAAATAAATATPEYNKWKRKCDAEYIVESAHGPELKSPVCLGGC